ncbi:MAG: AraC family transcriptional regulator [Candidatus Marinimicrobia bacterium]|nr:AraC family transcriptional regulator [Candidatus Neomarinimicrobiota bacterium]
MDNLRIHLAPLARLYPMGLPVQTIGYNDHRTVRTRKKFFAFSISIIFSGVGTYIRKRRTWQIAAPCVLIKWPDESFDYGPVDPNNVWEELYLIYDPGSQTEFQRRGLVNPKVNCWSIRRDAEVRTEFSQLMKLLTSVEQPGMADRIDRACELLIMEACWAEHPPPADRAEEAVRQIQMEVRAHPFAAHDFNELARRHGFSPATFRRHWNRYVDQPPARYAMTWRLREACRLLVETNLTVAEIAFKAGFEDPLYFSRCFHRLQGIAPSNYRARFAHHSLPGK